MKIDIQKNCEMFLYLSKEHTSALNRDIRKIGELSPSEIIHKYKRTLSKIEGDKKLQKSWKKERGKIMSIFKG